jgi:transposase-like protein
VAGRSACFKETDRKPRSWSALGYESWDDYCTREFGTSRLRLPREERSEVVSSLRESGLSIRAIASATGSGTRQIQEAIRERQVWSKNTPELDAVSDELAEELIAAEQELPPLPENYMNVPGGLSVCLRR